MCSSGGSSLSHFPQVNAVTKELPMLVEGEQEGLPDQWKGTGLPCGIRRVKFLPPTVWGWERAEPEPGSPRFRRACGEIQEERYERV